MPPNLPLQNPEIEPEFFVHKSLFFCRYLSVIVSAILQPTSGKATDPYNVYPSFMTGFPFLMLILNDCEVPGVGDEGEQGGHLQACPQ